MLCLLNLPRGHKIRLIVVPMGKDKDTKYI